MRCGCQEKQVSCRGALERWQPVSQVRDVTPTSPCPGQGQGKGIEAWGRLGTEWGVGGWLPAPFLKGSLNQEARLGSCEVRKLVLVNPLAHLCPGYVSNT